MNDEHKAVLVADKVNAGRKRQFRWAVVVVTLLALGLVANMTLVGVGLVKVNDLSNRVGVLRDEVDVAERQNEENRLRIEVNSQRLDAQDERFATFDRLADRIVAKITEALVQLREALPK